MNGTFNGAPVNAVALNGAPRGGGPTPTPARRGPTAFSSASRPREAGASRAADPSKSTSRSA